MNQCKECGIETHRPMYCSKPCSGKWRAKNVYGDRFTNKYRSSSPRNFMMSLQSKKRGRDEMSLDFLEDLYNKQNGKCAISGFDMTYITGSGRVPTNISIDRIDSNIGYVRDNVQLVCIQANKMKAELTMKELKTWVEAIYTNLGESNG